MLEFYDAQVQPPDRFTQFGVKPEEYFVVTTHCAETVDVPEWLHALVAALNSAVQKPRVPVVCLLRPPTAEKMKKFGVAQGAVALVLPMGLLNFARLDKEAFCALSDSGTEQEERCVFSMPSVTTRDATECRETIECRFNLLAGAEGGHIVCAIELVLRARGTWMLPEEHFVDNVSEVVARIVLGIA